MNRWFYLRLSSALLINLGRRILHEATDWLASFRNTVFHAMHSPFTHGATQPTPLPIRIPEIQRMYFYHPVDRRRAVQLVSTGEDGCYLVRPSSCPSSLTLTLCTCGKTYNIPIRTRPDRLYALGTRKPRELCFPSVLDMIKYYEKNPIIIADGGSCHIKREVKLTKSPPRQDC